MFNLLQKHKVSLVYIPLTVYWLILFVLTSLPSNRLPDAKINDKIEHYVAFGLLSFLLSLAFSFQRKVRFLYTWPLMWTIILVALYGMLDELHQLYVPGRYCDILDWTADVLGGLAGIGLVFLIKKFSKKSVLN